ncbi:hypothetical protein V6N12_058721 [Hibiscus sabdariffa]|uniref:Protein kinase domain-containing protein n=1 Tax=Hibiscus sabdariffa TaxID=183260 RepID=A0ABR2ESZ5_9ROSI
MGFGFASTFTFLLLLTTYVSLASAANSTAIPRAKLGCKDSCGAAIVPYPFGIGPNCSLDSWFESPVISKNCLGRGTDNNQTVDLRGSPFIYSASSNKFIAAGCKNRALMAGIEPRIVGCHSDCINGDTLFGTSNPNKTCNGTTCSETTMEYVPASVDWSVPYDSEFSRKSRCYIAGITNTVKYNISTRCRCEFGYQGNPYLSDGCIDINECLDESYQKICGHDSCVNIPGSYRCEGSKTWAIALGLGVGFGVLCLLIVGWLLYKFLKRRKAKLKRNFFKRNGGLLLQQQVHSREGCLEKTKIFTSKELDKATDNFNNNRVLGQGGQGTVFKGMLVDGRIVAVKKSKAMAAEKVDEFINEVVILSQINHRNVVKLLGCCFETEVPLLVYEFISNATLFQYLHDRTEEFQLSWETRLRIAREAAEALSYLHSSASIPIYHRDIKSTNILLDDKFKAKVSDFGTSRSISIDQTHLTTHVQGT